MSAPTVPAEFVGMARQLINDVRRETWLRWDGQLNLLDVA
jgi:hypothetical protein